MNWLFLNKIWTKTPFFAATVPILDQFYNNAFSKNTRKYLHCLQNPVSKWPTSNSRLHRRLHCHNKMTLACSPRSNMTRGENRRWRLLTCACQLIFDTPMVCSVCVLHHEGLNTMITTRFLPILCLIWVYVLSTRLCEGLGTTTIIRSNMCLLNYIFDLQIAQYCMQSLRRHFFPNQL